LDRGRVAWAPGKHHHHRAADPDLGMACTPPGPGRRASSCASKAATVKPMSLAVPGEMIQG
jgi:hypothetical protein